MKAKIQVQLTEAQLKWLDQEAARTGESRSAVVRNVINRAFPLLQEDRGRNAYAVLRREKPESDERWYPHEMAWSIEDALMEGSRNERHGYAFGQVVGIQCLRVILEDIIGLDKADGQ